MKLKVLVWPCTTEIGREVIKALRDDKDIELVLAASEGPWQGRFKLPDVSDWLWPAELRALVVAESITHIYPCHDAVINALAGNIELFDTAIIGQTPEAALTCDSKLATYQALRDVVTIPLNLYRTDSTRLAWELDVTAPLFVKPDAGNASRGTTMLRACEFDSAISDAIQRAIDSSRNGDALVCEYLPGPEFTIDCFSDRERGLLWYSTRSRDRTTGGISVATERISANVYGSIAPVMSAWATNISKALSMRGAWFFQVKLREDGEPALLEVGARIAGGSALARANGVNLPLLSLYESLRIPLKVMDTNCVTALRRPLANEYDLAFRWDALYIDLDDTLICKGQVNHRLMALCYKAVADNKKLVMLTRTDSGSAIGGKLTGYGISEHLFDDIFCLGSGSAHSKADYIRDKTGAIFIDDSFREREDVHQRLGIPVFDAAGAECLL